jgi:hypothetical protein
MLILTAQLTRVTIVPSLSEPHFMTAGVALTQMETGILMSRPTGRSPMVPMPYRQTTPNGPTKMETGLVTIQAGTNRMLALLLSAHRLRTGTDAWTAMETPTHHLTPGGPQRKERILALRCLVVQAKTEQVALMRMRMVTAILTQQGPTAPYGGSAMEQMHSQPIHRSGKIQTAMGMGITPHLLQTQTDALP